METRLYRPVHAEPRPEIETRIQQAESALGIRTKFDRLLEASLFIDKHFFDFALITGQTDGVERTFGHEEWAGHLEGRLFARRYGRQPLTVDFLLGLHTEIAKSSKPDIAGKLHPPGGRLVTEFPDIGSPHVFTDSQLVAIDANPALSFHRTGGVTTFGEGYIELPFMRDFQMLEQFQKICDWYNQRNNAQRQDAHQHAGTLEQRLVSAHPYWDYSGRWARAGMNWSLENNGQNPSILPDFNDDIFLEEKAWAEQVRNGSRRYGNLKKRYSAVRSRVSSEADITDEQLIAVFGLQRDKKLYDEIFWYGPKPPPLIPGKRHQHALYKTFLKDLRSPL